MKKRIAIPIEGDLLSAHFGHSQAFAFVNTEGNNITDITILTPPEHQHGAFPRWVAANGATDVIAGGMGAHAIELFGQNGVNAFVGAPIKSPKELVEDFLANRLTLTGKYCNHKEGDEHHKCHH
jgi:predicted Fe-Mo cluster-binding NifX family protein